VRQEGIAEAIDEVLRGFENGAKIRGLYRFAAAGAL